MKTSWSRCVLFLNVAQAYLERTKDKETKLRYAINRVLPRVVKQQETVNEKIADIEIDHCLTEKRGDQDVIVRDSSGSLQYTKETLKKRNTQIKEYRNADKIEIDPYLAAELPADLTVFEIEAFSGFVVRAEDADQLIQAIEARSTAGDNAEAAAVMADT